MRTPLTDPEARTSADTKARWAKIEGWISGELERRVRARLRHVVLGCSQCRQEEIAFALVKGFGMLHSEAALAMELLVEEYRMSEEGKRELKDLAAGHEPFLPHDAGSGEPPCGGVTRPDVAAAISLPFKELPKATVIDPNVPPAAVDYDAERDLDYHRAGDPANAALGVRRLRRGSYRVTLPPRKPAVALPVSPTREGFLLRFHDPAQDGDANGLTDEALLAVLFDRLAARQVAAPDRATLAAFRHVEMALNCLHEGTLRRALDGKIQKPVEKGG